MHPNDPLYAEQWQFTRLGNIEKIWDEYSGAGVHVGVYDGGVQSAHPDLAANYDASRHVVINGNPVSGEPSPTNPNAHGTGVTGILGAAANNGEGVVGVAWGSSLTSVPILNPDGPIDLNAVDGTNMLSAFHQMAGFDVTNHSWNAIPLAFYPFQGLHDVNSRHRFIHLEFEHATQDGRNGFGTVIVQGVGNDNLDAQGGGLNTSRYTITIAAIAEDGFAWEFSNYGACILVTAPGVLVYTTDLTGAAGGNPDGDYGRGTGTSFATPIVSGVVALMLQANPNLGWRDVQDILAASATHTGSAIGALGPGTNENGNWYVNDAANWNGGGMHFSNDYGYGVVNAYNAVRMAEAWSSFQTAQTSANEGSWSNWKWGGGNVATGIAIPDNGSINESILLAPSPSGIEIEHVDVTIDLEHQHFNDLRIYLTSPQGTEIQLYDGSGATLAPVDTEFTWTFGVDALRGELAAGNWQLRIEDAVAGDTGQLYWFEVKAYGKSISSDASARNDTYHYTDEFLAMKALEAGRGTLSDAGGSDWIDAAAVTGNFALNLNAGMGSSVNGAAWFAIASGTVIENAVSGDGNDTLTGSGASNTLLGMRGNDTLDGGLGNDTLKGGKGHDTYVIGSAGDVADETGANGTDLVRSAVTFSLADTIHAKGVIENLTLLAGAANATGNAFANLLIGNAAANVLNGLAGADTMTGLAGNDSYVVDNGFDKVSEAGGAGIDTVSASFSFSLANTARVLGVVENLVLANVAAALTGIGNNFNNLIAGNNFANTLRGGVGNDRLNGGLGNDSLSGDAGNDVLNASNGNDTLIGGTGLDTLTGGANNDLFVFNAPLSVANRDIVTDFFAPQDTFRLENAVMPKLGAGVHALSAAFFRAGPAALDANDFVIYNRANGNLSYDSNANLAGGVTLLAVLTTKPLLTAADFAVI